MSRDLESRVQELEDIMAIENLKHTYLNACDAKDVELMKSTFKADHCDIDYGPVGKFNHREDLVKLLSDLKFEKDRVETYSERLDLNLEIQRVKKEISIRKNNE